MGLGKLGLPCALAIDKNGHIPEILHHRNPN